MMPLIFVRQSVLIKCVCQQYRQLDQAQEINEALSNYWRQREKNVQKPELKAYVRNELLVREFGESGTAVDLCIVNCQQRWLLCEHLDMDGGVDITCDTSSKRGRTSATIYLGKPSLGRTFMEKMFLIISGISNGCLDLIPI
jgi:hypothetical protein